LKAIELYTFKSSPLGNVATGKEKNNRCKGERNNLDIYSFI
jgi:hypothetical protein